MIGSACRLRRLYNKRYQTRMDPASSRGSLSPTHRRGRADHVRCGQGSQSLGVVIIGGHTGYSSGLLRPFVAVTALAPAEGKRVVTTGGSRPGDVVYVTYGVGLEGTGILASDFAVEARKRGLSEYDLAEATALLSSVSVVPEALALADLGATAMHDVIRGGVLETLLEIAACSGVSLKIDECSIPVPPVVCCFAQAFGFHSLEDDFLGDSCRYPTARRL